jgi:TPR repeat protein
MKKIWGLIALGLTCGLAIAVVDSTPVAAMSTGQEAAQAAKTAQVLTDKQRQRTALKIYKQTFFEFAAGNQDGAITDLQTAATMGNVQAAAELGELYQNGFHEYRLTSGYDYAKAQTWDSIAAAMGSGRGYTNIGILYYNGWGVTKDLTKAMTNFKQGYALKDMKAPRYLGMIYEAKKNYTKAAKYYQAAYKTGDITGGISLAQLHLDGNGVKQSTSDAIKIYKKLLKDANGNSKAGDAAVAWGNLYVNGKYVTKDLAKAKEIYQKGVALKSEAAKAAIAKIQ